MRFLVYIAVGLVTLVLAAAAHGAGYIGIAWVAGFTIIAVGLCHMAFRASRNRQQQPD